MKKLLLALASLMTMSFSFVNGQTINWNRIGEVKHIANINIAAEHALNYGVGYSYRIKSKRPVLFNSEYTFPSGQNLFDDFKIKTGTQIRWWQSGNFHIASKFQGIFRRYNNDYARLLNFGADISATGGYYKRKWFIAGEIGFDKAIVTHFKHSDLYKSNFPRVKDGWYEPSTGGNFSYGVQGGLSGKNKDVYLKLGKLTQQDLRSSPMLPFYAQIGLNLRFANRR
jgi:hypothetical protein